MKKELETGTADVDAWYAERSGRSLINYGVSAGHLPARVAVAVGTKPALTPAASATEVLEVFRAAGRFRAPVVIHLCDLRDESLPAETRRLLAFDEALADATVSGAPLHVAHA